MDNLPKMNILIGNVGFVDVPIHMLSASKEFFIHEFVTVDLKTRQVNYPLADKRKKWVVSHRVTGLFMTKPLFKNHAIAAMRAFDALGNEIDWHSDRPYRTCSPEVWNKAKRIRFKFDNYA